MKYPLLVRVCAALIAAMFIASSCSTGSEVDEVYAEYITGDDYKKDLDNFFFAGSLQQAMGTLIIHACSNEFTCTENDTVNFGDRKMAYWRDYAAIMATIEEHQDEFKQSYRRLEYMGVFDKPTPQLDAEGNVVAMGPRRAVDCTDPESRAMALLAAPAHAGTMGGILLFTQAFYEFCGITSDLARESRKQIITVAAKLSDSDRKELFNELSKHERQGETDYKTWWNNFADGKYDVQAHRIYRTIIAANDSPGKTNYLSVADDMGILTEKEFCSKAGRAITAGAKLYVECVNKVVGSVAGDATVFYGNMAKGENIKATVVSYDKVYDALDKINNTVEYGRKIGNGTLKQDDVDEYNMNVIKAIVADETSGWVVKLGKDTKIPLDGHLGGGEFVEYGQVVWSELKKRAEARNDPKLTWGSDEERMAQIKITDKDGKPTGMVIARDKETGAIYAVKEKEFNGDLAVKVPAGEYSVTAIDKDGDKQTLTGVKVKEGEKKEVDVVKNEQEIIQNLIEMHKDDSQSNFDKWWKGFKQRRAEKKEKERLEKEKKEAEEKAKEEAEAAREAKEKAEQEAKEKAEQEAKAKAEQEAKAKAEQEAKAKAEAGNPAAPKPKTDMPFSLVGRWRIVDVKVSGTLANEVPEAAIKGKIQEFKANGTYTVSGKSGSGRYKYSGGSSITLDGAGYAFKQLSPNRIQITYTENYSVGKKMQTLKSVMTLERIGGGETPKQDPQKVDKPAPKPAPAPATATKKKKRTYRHVSGTY